MPVELFCAVAGDQAQQHVADVRDGRVGQQPLEVGLRDRRQVAAGHGGDGDEDQQRHVHRAQRDRGRTGRCAAASPSPRLSPRRT